MTDRKGVSLEVIQVQSPCHEPFHEMKPEGSRRFCSHCGKYVHDLSKMTRPDVEELICRSAGELCVRFARDEQGKVITLDYQPPTAPKSRGMIWLAIFAGTLVSACEQAIFLDGWPGGRVMGGMPVPPPTQQVTAIGGAAPTTQPAGEE